MFLVFLVLLVLLVPVLMMLMMLMMLLLWHGLLRFCLIYVYLCVVSVVKLQY